MSNYPHSRGLILRKVRSSLAQSTLQTFEDEVLQPGYYLIADGPTREGRRSYRYRNGSEIVVAGLDKPSKILSSEYDICLIDQAEEIEKEEDIELLLTRMSCNHIKDKSGNAWQQVIYLCNPAWPGHWLNQRFEKQSEKRKRIFIGHKCNPKFWQEKTQHWTNLGKHYLDNLKSTMSGVQYQRLYEGKWAASDKLVYPEFEVEKHLARELPEVDKVVVGVDFGWRAGAAVIVAFHKDIMYVTSTYAYAERQISEWADILKTVRDRYFCSFKVVCDSAEPRSIEQLKKAGLNAVPVKKGQDSVKTGISLIKTRLNDEGLFVMYDACKSHCDILAKNKVPQTITDEFYSYESDKEGKPISKHNHLCFAAGTKISTPNGYKHIEDLKVGDKVYSHLGIDIINASRCSGIRNVMIYNVGGNKLVATADHPFYVDGHYRSILCYNIKINSDILSLQMIKTSGCKDMYGSFIMGLSKKDITYITKMAINLTTIYQISNACQHQNILDYIRMDKNLKTSLRSLENGIRVLLGSSGIKSMDLNHGKIENQLQEKMLNIVQIIANLKQEDKVELIILRRIVLFVEKILSQISIYARNVAPVYVQENLAVKIDTQKEKKQKVYNLSTFSGTYFAEDILVSNCDALRYVVLEEDKKNEYVFAMSSDIDYGEDWNDSIWRDL